MERVVFRPNFPGQFPDDIQKGPVTKINNTEYIL